ncbi:site-specific tyrosine recombinase XerD, partial [Francisella tularensis]|nr:site-specific tyrosine recombinase XerD [Francisella tularensis]
RTLQKLCQMLPKGMTETVCELFFKITFITEAFGIRDKAILELMIAKVLCVRQLVGLKIDDIKRNIGVIQIMVYGSQVRLVLIVEYA